MTLKKKIQIGIATLTLALVGTALAQRHHPNLFAAEEHIDAAMAKVSEAQRANEFDMNGHAQRAKELLEQAKHEIHEAAVAADRR